jgi:tetratricopeptide (TPR) repeat protein
VAEQAEALYGAGDDVIDLLARHVYLGGGRNAPDYLLRAGRRARGLYANDEAILHLTRCSELVPENLDLQLELADLHELVGDYEQALRLYQQVRDADGRVPSWRGLVAVHRKRGEFADALAAVDAAFVDDRSAGADLGPLWLEAGWTLWVAGRSDEAADVLRAGLEAAAGREDTTVGQLLLQVALVDLTRGDVDTALRDALHAQRLFEAAEEPRHLARTMRVLGSVLGRAGRLDEAAAALERGLGLAERTGNVEEIGGCLINLGLVSYERGRIADAIAYDRRALEEFERVGLDSGRALAYANLGHKLAESGVVEEALQWAERALQLAQSIGRLVTVADAIDTMASIALHEGRYLEAAESAERAAETYLEAGAAPQAAEALARAVMAWEQAGEAGRAREARARSLTA